MSKRLSLGWAAVVSFAVASCGGGQTPPPQDHTAEIGVLQQQVKQLNDRLQKAENAVFMQSLSGPQESAVFDPQDAKKYSAIRAPAGPVLAILEKVEPYLDGFTVTIRIGNPTNATYVGIKGKVKWGRSFDFSKDEQWNKLAEKDLDLVDSLPPGTWSLIKFNVAPATPEQVRRIVFEPSLNQIRMRSGVLGD